MKTITTMLCVAVFASSAMGETFSLRDTATKKMHGPFHFKDGTQIRIGGAKWEIERLDPRRDELIAAMKKLRIPSLDFREAGIEDVVLFLSETVRRLGAEDLNIVLGRNADKTKPITMSIRDISLLDVIEYACHDSGHRWEIRHGVVMLERKDDSEKAANPPSATGMGTEELFYLKNVATGKTHGPFPLKNKAYVRIGSTVLTVSQDPAPAKTIEALKAMNIPSLAFRDASIQDIVTFLNATSKKLALNPNIQIVLGDKATKIKYSATLSLRNKSLYDIVGILCDQTDLQWAVRDGTVVLEKE